MALAGTNWCLKSKECNKLYYVQFSGHERKPITLHTATACPWFSLHSILFWPNHSCISCCICFYPNSTSRHRKCNLGNYGAPWCRILLEKLTGLQLVKKFPAFYETRSFITALTSVRHLSLSWASPIQSTYPHPTSRRSILILSTHLRLGLPSGLFPSGFPSLPPRTNAKCKRKFLCSTTDARPFQLSRDTQ